MNKLDLPEGAVISIDDILTLNCNLLVYLDGELVDKCFRFKYGMNGWVDTYTDGYHYDERQKEIVPTWETKHGVVSYECKEYTDWKE